MQACLYWVMCFVNLVFDELWQTRTEGGDDRESLGLVCVCVCVWLYRDEGVGEDRAGGHPFKFIVTSCLHQNHPRSINRSPLIHNTCIVIDWFFLLLLLLVLALVLSSSFHGFLPSLASSKSVLKRSCVPVFHVLHGSTLCMVMAGGACHACHYYSG